MDIHNKLMDIELRLANIEAILRSHNIWPDHLRDDPLYLDELKKDFRERGVEAIHEYNRSRAEHDYQRARQHGTYAEALVYKGRVRRKGYLYDNHFYFRWGAGLRAVTLDAEDLVILGEGE